MIRRSFVRSATLGVVLAALYPANLVAQAKGTTVYLVRHAEKGTTPAADPPLTSAGEARARALATLLADSGVTAVITTNLVRTRDTGKPLAAARTLAPVAITVHGSTAAHVTAVADAVRRQAGGGPFLPALGQVVQATRSGLLALQAAAQTGKAQERHDARADFARLLSGETGAGDIDLDAEVRRLVATGNVIGAIKIVRDTKGLSLAAAKEYVDRASAG